MEKKNMAVYLYQEAAMYPLSPAITVNLTGVHLLHPFTATLDEYCQRVEDSIPESKKKGPKRKNYQEG